MSNTVIEQVTVDSLSKYGIKVGNEYYNWSKSLSEAEKGRVVPGGTFDMELFVADSGKKYINKVVASWNFPANAKEAPKAIEPKPANAKVSPAPVAKATETMTKADWNAKDRSQLIGGLSHDAATLVAAAIHVWGTMADAASIVMAHKQVLEGLLKNRDEIK